MRDVVDINCDMGEGFGSWSFGEDVDGQMLPYVTSANLAAGFHAGDPTTIADTAARALAAGVGIGVHPGFGDLVGFGRRHINAHASELVNDTLYQLGAVRELLRRAGGTVQHIKLHGALYMHAARDEAFATAFIDALQQTDSDLPVLVMAGTVVEQIAIQRHQPVVREFYADRHYGDDGQIVFTRDVGRFSPEQTAEKVLLACTEGVVRTVTGDTVPVTFESICIHSDTPGALDLMLAIDVALRSEGIQVEKFASPNNTVSVSH